MNTDLTEKFSALASEAFVHALELSDPALLVREQLEIAGGSVRTGKRTWERAGRVAVIAAGKAAAPMARAAAQVLGGRTSEGLLVAPTLPDELPAGFEPIAAEHPSPGAGSLRAATRAARIAGGLGENDLLVLLLSGGASSLLGAPASGLSPDAFHRIWGALLSSGADIIDMNIVRKHASLLGGGKLALLAAPARVETLAISDVPGDDPASIGSGPCVPDASTFAQALGVLERFNLTHVHPEVAGHFRNGIQGKLPETLRPEDPVAALAGFTLLDSAREVLKRIKLQLTLIPDVRIWESAQLGGIDYQVRRLLKELEGAPTGRPAALLCAGEPTAPVPRDAGSGGRASHFALEFALTAEKAGPARFVLLSGASDGADGNTGAAGALITHESLPRARARGLAPEVFLQHFDSGSLFEQTGEAVFTGPTGTNVSDLRIAITW
ncbi:MAG: DUF4147 domain-containing protein [Chrysiogenetes bacterium]|nr:DUF4147 domain-containing protein [Chrysiogenetes bacterium]